MSSYGHASTPAQAHLCDAQVSPYRKTRSLRCRAGASSSGGFLALALRPTHFGEVVRLAIAPITWALLVMYRPRRMFLDGGEPRADATLSRWQVPIVGGPGA